MSRRELRTNVFLLLFQTFYYDRGEMEEQTALFLELLEKPMDEHDTEYVKNKVDCIMDKMPEIDKAIDEKAENWKINRMNYVDLTLIRLAVYEMRYEEDVPTAVAINEAVELAKLYGGDDSYSFVNGLLSKLL